MLNQKGSKKSQDLFAKSPANSALFAVNIIHNRIVRLDSVGEGFRFGNMSRPINFNTSKIFRTNLAFPHAVITDNLIFVSGTAGFDPTTGKVVSDKFEEQAVQAFRNIKAILEDAGSGLNKVVKTTVFMVSGCDPDFKVINKVYTDFFPQDPPARSAPQVMPFPAGILISVECIALV